MLAFATGDDYFLPLAKSPSLERKSSKETIHRNAQAYETAASYYNIQSEDTEMASWYTVCFIHMP
jgi:hypothetical protein